MREAWDGSESVNAPFSVREYLRSMPHVCRTILFFTLGVFLAQLVLHYALGKGTYQTHVLKIVGLVPADIFSYRLTLWQLVTYLFVHSTENPLHILFNMFVFAMFAPDVERAMGGKRFGLLYFISGTFGGLLQCLVMPFDQNPIIGASGAVLGVLAAYGSLFPKRVIYLFMVFPMKAKHCMFLLVALELLSAIMGIQQFEPSTMNPFVKSIAYFAHIGGFFAGFLFIRYEWTVRGMLLRGIERHYDREHESDRQLRERVDELLDKVAREGAANLTWRERNFLKRAGKRLKRQRARYQRTR